MCTVDVETLRSTPFDHAYGDQVWVRVSSVTEFGESDFASTSFVLADTPEQVDTLQF